MAFLSPSTTARRRAGLATTLAVLCILAVGEGRGQERRNEPVPASQARTSANTQAFSEYEVKAEFLVRLTHPQFTTWPGGTDASADDPVIVALVGEDRFQDSLDRAVRQRHRPFVILRLGNAVGAAADEPADVLFVPASLDDRYGQILALVNGLPVLTIGEDRAFLEAGGLISLRIESSHPVIEIARERAEGRGFRFSSQLLRLARIYPPTGGAR